MSDSGSPALSEIIEFISNYVLDFGTKHSRAVHGAQLAEAMKEQFPDLDYAQLGVTKLADVVKMAEASGRVVRQTGVKHLELRAPGAYLATEASSVRVRPPIWRAFVFVPTPQNCILDKATGRLLTDAEYSRHVSNLDVQHAGFVRIDSIPPETQQRWMREFLEQHNLPQAEEAPIESARWWEAFPYWLRGQDNPTLVPEWHRTRSKRVIAHIEAWASTSDVPIAMLFETELPSTRLYQEKGTTSLACSERVCKTDQMRKAVLAAINEMPLEHLENLAIPVKYILKHFTAR